MEKKTIFLSHPEVVVNPNIKVPDWELSEKGIERMEEFCKREFDGIVVEKVFSSNERKAVDGAEVVLKYVKDSNLISISDLGEMDRSSTGFLPEVEFLKVAKKFFENPTESIKGWEVAIDCQKRIVNTVKGVVENNTEFNNLIVSHGGVGALLLAYLKKSDISYDFEQPATGGGNYFVIDNENFSIESDWITI